MSAIIGSCFTVLVFLGCASAFAIDGWKLGRYARDNSDVRCVDDTTDSVCTKTCGIGTWRVAVVCTQYDDNGDPVNTNVIKNNQQCCNAPCPRDVDEDKSANKKKEKTGSTDEDSSANKKKEKTGSTDKDKSDDKEEDKTADTDEDKTHKADKEDKDDGDDEDDDDDDDRGRGGNDDNEPANLRCMDLPPANGNARRRR